MTINDVLGLPNLNPEQIIILSAIEREFVVSDVQFVNFQHTTAFADMLNYSNKKMYFAFAVEGMGQQYFHDKNNIALRITQITDINRVKEWTYDPATGQIGEVASTSELKRFRLENILFSKIETRVGVLTNIFKFVGLIITLK